MGRPIVVAASALALAAALAGCGGTSQPSTVVVGEVALHVTGGFAGWDRTLVVGPHGELTYTVQRGPAPVAPATYMDAQTLARLHSLVSEPAFARLKAEYPPPPGGADLQRYAVTARVGNRTLTTVTWDGADPPQVLRDVLDIITGTLPRTVT